MSDTKTTFSELVASLPESVRADKRQVLAVARAAGVEVPYSERFYLTTHTPQRSARNPNPAPTEYLAIPSPNSGRDFWVQKSEVIKLIEGLTAFAQSNGLL